MRTLSTPSDSAIFFLLACFEVASVLNHGKLDSLDSDAAIQRRLKIVLSTVKSEVGHQKEEGEERLVSLSILASHTGASSELHSHQAQSAVSSATKTKEF